jgi:protein tyrosine phosphatase
VIGGSFGRDATQNSQIRRELIEFWSILWQEIESRCHVVMVQEEDGILKQPHCEQSESTESGWGVAWP